ncbi:Multidrug efflux RND transporter MexF [Pseudomonas syringae pv. helianthi]|uniref:Multidrug efflux RND transporter MexF n=1 Tax=Pseudomonas syringae pv. helianthi TaxID=251654 RepID=A0A0P9TNJ7_9PSED|nr:Multidrug efflux RND transporter MexF [Pseudomonas syringae pv. helianthi]
MNFSKFFISRPIFAAVLSLLILIAGAISLFQLPISEYPEVVPPTVVVRANFPGANPKVIGETVASPLEQAITGVEGMLYMSSQATADGKLTLTITFALGTELDNAQVQVQNRVTRTEPKLPEEVTRIGITVDKASPDLTMVVHLTSPDTSATTCCTCPIMPCSTSRMSWHDWAVSVMCNCSAWATIRYVSGWTPTRLRRAT